jgi:hypothetical protein
MGARHLAGVAAGLSAALARAALAGARPGAALAGPSFLSNESQAVAR